MNTRTASFRRRVLAYYKKHGRHALPWRKTRDPYKVLVSEVMLQQTQVDRVMPFYRDFLKKFPTARALARAPLSDVIRAWQGLGYNRRAKFLHEAAKAIVAGHGGRVPRGKDALMALPGIGAYTAAAVRAFAFNEPDVFIETNIRTAFIHHFFPKKKNIADSALVPYMELTLDRKNPREWYFALMDYGAHLKKTEGNASRRSAHHVKQKPFKGSDREIRGAILRKLAEGACTEAVLLNVLSFPVVRTQEQLAALFSEGLIARRRRTYALAT
ncbi:MAG: A/G-specific adenine glycosylase [Patescibacteria group bacterium]|nr:A/G-specific adenine glycosylase [Patescibacteria group bacterium]